MSDLSDVVITIHEEEVRLLEWAAVALREPTTAQDTASARSTLDTVLRTLKTRIAKTKSI